MEPHFSDQGEKASDGLELTPDVARDILNRDFRPEERERMDHLALRAQAGELNAEETIELHGYVQAGHGLAMLQSTARRVLIHVNGAPDETGLGLATQRCCCEAEWAQGCGPLSGVGGRIQAGTEIAALRDAGR